MTHKSVPSSPRGPGDGPQPMSPVGCLIQFASGFGGFAVIVLIWVTILREPPWTFTFKDILYWATAFGMIAARHVSFVRYGADGSGAEPATNREPSRSTLTLLLVDGLLWCVGQAVHL